MLCHTVRMAWLPFILICAALGVAGVLGPPYISSRVEIAKYNAERAQAELLTAKLEAIQYEGVDLETLRALGVLKD